MEMWKTLASRMDFDFWQSKNAKKWTGNGIKAVCPLWDLSQLSPSTCTAEHRGTGCKRRAGSPSRGQREGGRPDQSWVVTCEAVNFTRQAVVLSLVLGLLVPPQMLMLMRWRFVAVGYRKPQNQHEQ